MKSKQPLDKVPEDHDNSVDLKLAQKTKADSIDKRRLDIETTYEQTSSSGPHEFFPETLSKLPSIIHQAHTDNGDIIDFARYYDSEIIETDSTKASAKQSLIKEAEEATRKLVEAVTFNKASGLPENTKLINALMPIIATILNNKHTITDKYLSDNGAFNSWMRFLHTTIGIGPTIAADDTINKYEMANPAAAEIKPIQKRNRNKK